MRVWVVVAASVVLAGFPLVWFAPLFSLKIDLRFWADATEFSVVSTLQTLWRTDPALALLVSFLALFAPVLKVTGIILIEAGLLVARVKPGLEILGRLAMADVFLIALAVAMIKGLEGGTLTIRWGFWAFAGLVLASVLLGWLCRPVQEPARNA